MHLKLDAEYYEGTNTLDIILYEMEDGWDRELTRVEITKEQLEAVLKRGDE